MRNTEPWEMAAIGEYARADLREIKQGKIPYRPEPLGIAAETLPSAVEVLREVLDHFRAAEHLPDDLYATALLVAYGGGA